MTTNLQKRIAEDLGSLFDEKLRDALFHHLEMSKCAELSGELVVGYPLSSMSYAFAVLVSNLNDDDRKWVFEIFREHVTEFVNAAKERRAHGR